MKEKLNRSNSNSSIELKLNDRRAKEKGLIDRAVAGDELAYTELVGLYKGKVAATVYSILGRDYVEEISHEAFIRAFGSIKEYRRDSSFYTYVIKIAVNLCRDEIRRKQIKRIFNFTEIFGRGGNDNASDGSYAQEQIRDGTAGDPVSVYDTGETISIVREEMEKLPVILREAVTLREIDELSYGEISKLLRISVGTAKTRVFRARQVLRDRLIGRINYGK